MGLGCPEAPLKCGWKSFRGLSSEHALALVGALRATGSGLATRSTPPTGLAAGRAPGSRLAAAGGSARRAFLASPSFIVLAREAAAASSSAAPSLAEEEEELSIT